MSSTEGDFGNKGKNSQLDDAQKDTSKAPKLAVGGKCPHQDRQINVITPVLTGDELALCHRDFQALCHPDVLNPGQTTLSQIQVSFDETIPGQRPGNLGVRVTFGNQIACFEDANQTTEFASGDTLAHGRLGGPFTLHMRGAAQGNCTMTATITGDDGGDWHFADPVNKDIHVERLRLDARLFSDGRRTPAQGDANNLAAGMPKTRELHQRNGNTFTFARFAMHRPDNAFWPKATRITLSVNGGTVGTYSNDTATAVLINIGPADFAAEVHQFWVRCTGAADALDVEPGGAINWPAWAALNPEKDITNRYVSCGATEQGTNRELVLGDLVRLETFSFDRYLDRNVRNECGNRVQPDPNNVAVTGDVALAKAAPHKFYGAESPFQVNHSYRANGSSPFTAFITYMCNSNNMNHARNRGANFVQNHLQNEHGIALSNDMKTAIRNYISGVLNGGGWAQRAAWPNNNQARGQQATGLGFQRLYGVPGTHAEVLAADWVMQRGLAAADTTVATYMLQNQPGHNNRQGKRFVACPNCAGILNPAGFRVITG